MENLTLTTSPRIVADHAALSASNVTLAGSETSPSSVGATPSSIVLALSKTSPSSVVATPSSVVLAPSETSPSSVIATPSSVVLVPSVLSDDELLRQVRSLVAAQRQQLADLLEFLGEVEDRRLHLARGYSSMFDFCTAALHMSEGEAFRRIAAARLARRFPTVFAAIAEGSVHLSGLVLLRDHLTEENHAELLQLAAHKSKRAIDVLLAERFPRPDVKSYVRKLPARRPKGQSDTSKEVPDNTVVDSPTPPTRADDDAVIDSSTTATRADDGAVIDSSTTATRADDDAVIDSSTTATRADDDAVIDSSTTATRADDGTVIDSSTTATRADDNLLASSAASFSVGPVNARHIEPLAPARYRVQLTATQELKDKLDRARRLLGHSSPASDLAPVLERALDLLLIDLEKSRRAKTTRPRRQAPPSDPGAISRAARRAVFERDGEQCTFVGPDGLRCPSQTFLELDHIQPRALGGPGTPENRRPGPGSLSGKSYGGYAHWDIGSS